MTTTIAPVHHRSWLSGFNLLLALVAIALAVVALARMPDDGSALSGQPPVAVDAPLAPAVAVDAPAEAPAVAVDEPVAPAVPAARPVRREAVAFYGCDGTVSGGNRC